MCKLKNENNLVIQKADKSNTIVILDKDSYLKSVETLLKDSSKFKNIPIKGGCRRLPLLPMQHTEMAHINFQSFRF